MSFVVTVVFYTVSVLFYPAVTPDTVRVILLIRVTSKNFVP